MKHVLNVYDVEIFILDTLPINAYRAFSIERLGHHFYNRRFFLLTVSCTLCFNAWVGLEGCSQPISFFPI